MIRFLTAFSLAVTLALALVVVPIAGDPPRASADDDEATTGSGPDTTPGKTDANDPRFHELLRHAAAGYQAWGRIDDQARWAPHLCRMPFPGRARFSASEHADTHGQKIYLLYAKDPRSYAGMPESVGRVVGPERQRALDALAGVEQVIVKESWTPRESVDGERKRVHVEPAERGGKSYEPGDLRGLYVMLRLATDTEGTDEGWVYGTLTPDGRVTGSGRMGTCMGCHVQAPGDDRLFGLGD